MHYEALKTSKMRLSLFKTVVWTFLVLYNFYQEYLACALAKSYSLLSLSQFLIFNPLYFKYHEIQFFFFNCHFITFPGTLPFSSQPLSSFTLINWHLLNFSSYIYRVSEMSTVSTFPQSALSSINFMYVQFKFLFHHYHVSFFAVFSLFTNFLFQLLNVTWAMPQKQGSDTTIYFAVYVWTK